MSFPPRRKPGEKSCFSGYSKDLSRSLPRACRGGRDDNLFSRRNTGNVFEFHARFTLFRRPLPHGRTVCGRASSTGHDRGQKARPCANSGGILRQRQRCVNGNEIRLRANRTPIRAVSGLFSTQPLPTRITGCGTRQGPWLNLQGRRASNAPSTKTSPEGYVSHGLLLSSESRDLNPGKPEIGSR